MGFRSTENQRLQARHAAGAAIAPLVRGLVETLNVLLNTRTPAIVQHGFFAGSTLARVPDSKEFRLTDPAGRTIAVGHVECAARRVRANRAPRAEGNVRSPSAPRSWPHSPRAAITRHRLHVAMFAFDASTTLSGSAPQSDSRNPIRLRDSPGLAMCTLPARERPRPHAEMESPWRVDPRRLNRLLRRLRFAPMRPRLPAGICRRQNGAPVYDEMASTTRLA